MKHGGCFDCGTLKQKVLTSITIKVRPRETNRGVVKPGASSVALCDACLEKAKRD